MPVLSSRLSLVNNQIAYLPTLDWEDEEHEVLRFSLDLAIQGEVDWQESHIWRSVLDAVCEVGGQVWVDETEDGHRINARLPIRCPDDEQEVVEQFAHFFANKVSLH